MSKPYVIHRYCILISLLLMNNLAMASFDKNIWARWVVYTPQSRARISHEEWQTFLTQRVVTNEEGINLVDYPHLTKTDISLLNRYITRLSTVNIRDYNRNEQLAFWINFYNALIVQAVARHYPVSSIQEVNISPGLFSTGPWGASLVALDGVRLSLDEIQNRIIRPIWNDPRTHYAINDATIGCANLSKKAYEGATIDAQLNQAASEYINSLRGVQLIDHTLVVSKIYEWYLADFGNRDADLIYHLAQYAKEPLKSKLQTIHTIDDYLYNWHLNSTVAHPS